MNDRKGDRTQNVSVVDGFTVVWIQPLGDEPEKYGVQTGRLRTPGNYWPKVFDYFSTQEEAERWIRQVLAPSTQKAVSR